MNKSPMNMHNPEERDWLDKILAGSHEYIHDDGFTDRVIRRLPAPRAQRNPGLRAGIFGCALLLAAAVLLLSVPDPVSLYENFTAFLYSQSLYSLSALAIAIYAAVTAVTYWVIDPDI
jgi:hypothetical protein